MDLKQRLEILRDSETIDRKTYDTMVEVIKMFKKEYGITLTEENGAMLITHLSMAIMRIKKGAPVDKMNLDVYNEIMESEYFEKSKKMYESLEKVLEMEMPEDEKKYMIVNMCLLLDNINEEGE